MCKRVLCTISHGLCLSFGDSTDLPVIDALLTLCLKLCDFFISHFITGRERGPSHVRHSREGEGPHGKAIEFYVLVYSVYCTHE